MPVQDHPTKGEGPVTKDQFAEKLAKKADISKAKAKEVIDNIFSTEPRDGIIATELDAGRDFTITGFGTFSTRNRKARTGRNPQTGQTIQIPSMTVPTFRAGRGLKERVRV
jgi:DNA-binding protein HU-beta